MDIHLSTTYKAPVCTKHARKTTVATKSKKMARFSPLNDIAMDGKFVDFEGNI